MPKLPSTKSVIALALALSLVPSMAVFLVKDIEPMYSIKEFQASSLDSYSFPTSRQPTSTSPRSKKHRTVSSSCRVG